MNEQFVLELKKLLGCFPKSYINRNLEVILTESPQSHNALDYTEEVVCSPRFREYHHTRHMRRRELWGHEL